MEMITRSSDGPTDGIESTLQQLRDDVAAARALADLASRSPDGLARLTLDGHFTEVNPAVERLLGWHPEVLCGRSITKLAHPDDRPGVDARIARLLTGLDGPDARGLEERLVFRARRVDARFAWLEVALRIEVNGDDRIVGLVGSLREVHERHEAHLLDRRRMTEHAALMRIGRTIAAGTDERGLVRAAAEELSDVLTPRSLLIYRVDEPGRVAVCEATAHADGGFAAATPVLDVPLGADSPVARAVAGGCSIAMDYGDCTSDFGRGLSLMWRLGLATPIVADDAVWGAMVALYGYGDPAPEDGVQRVLEYASELVGLAVARM